MLAELVKCSTAAPASQDPEDSDKEDVEEAGDETDDISYLYKCAEQLKTSLLSFDCQKQMRDLSYASLMLHTHKDISM
jgi:hypothetical protein